MKLRLSYHTSLDHHNTSSYSTANKHMCVSLQNQLFGRSAAKHTGARVGPERGAEAVQAVRSDRMTSRTAVKMSPVYSLVRCGSVSAVARAQLTGLAPGTLLSISDEK